MILLTINAHVLPVDDDQVAIARDAALRFARGRHESRRSDLSGLGDD